MATDVTESLLVSHYGLTALALRTMFGLPVERCRHDERIMDEF